VRPAGGFLACALATAAMVSNACDRPPPQEQPATEDIGPAEDVLAGLVAADRAFEGMAADDGVDAAFQAYMSPEGVLFRPGPVAAGAWLSENAFGLASLRWVPTTAALAASGDLGYTTGPYIATDTSGQESHGHYLSIWATNADGGFHVVLDTGTPGPDTGPLPESPEVADPFESASRSADPGAEPGSDALTALLAVDRGYAVVQATEGTVAALGTYAARSVWIQRPGVVPAVGIEALEADRDRIDERISTSPIDGRVSASGTLGYVYGSVAQGGQADRGNYVRIWRRDPGAPWTLALELVDVASE